MNTMMLSITDFFAEFYTAFIVKNRFLWYLEGLGMTLFIALFACVIGIAIGFMVAILKLAPQDNLIVKILTKIGNLYTTIIRGTPVLVQLFLMYYVILLNIKSGVLIAIITFGLNSGAYVSEIIRGGLQAVDKGQMEAGRSLGFTWGKTMQYVILPQGIKSSIPSLFNEFIQLVKETSIVGMIAIVDLTKVAEKIISITANAMAPYIIIAIMYLLVVIGLQQIQKLLEKKFAKGDRV